MPKCLKTLKITPNQLGLESGLVVGLDNAENLSEKIWQRDQRFKCFL